MKNDIEKIFGFYASGSSIFSRKDFLQSSYVPDELPHREDLVKQLAQILAPSLRLERPSNVFIYGKSGTGKTAVTLYVGSMLQKTAQEKNIPVKFMYVNTGLKKVADTEYRLYAHLCRMMGEFIPDTGVPTHSVFEKLVHTLENNPSIYLLVLDEVDVLVEKSPEALYTLSRINSELKNSQVSIVGITNDFNVVNNLDSRTKSSLSEEEIIFPPYDADQIYEILKQRDTAFSPGVLDDSVIMLCAASSAKEHGDARRALELLRISAELAERETSLKVMKKHVKDAISKMYADNISGFVNTLPHHQKLVLHALVSLDKPLSYTREVYDKYVEISTQTGLKELTMRRVLDILGDFESAGIVRTNVISRGRYGRTKIVELTTADNIKDQIESLLVSL
ncbi:MAG: AAA family ATPase [Candidatus Altiarchaeota archaeon]|nr:AAA family ATPase [Candidatus Altiarchaeota archaeon]